MQRLNLDIHCASADIDVNGVIYVFDSAQQFIDETGFNFPDAKKVFFEPERNIYVIERSGGRCEAGPDLPEFEWINEHAEDIFQAGLRVEEARKPTITWQMERFAKLSNTDWLVTRHLEQQQLGMTTSLSAEQYTQLIAFRQSLRDLTEENHQFPPPPSFVQLG